MRRAFVASVILSLTMVFLAPPAMAGSSSVPGNSHAFGNSRSAWALEYAQWIFGDESNPLFSGDCGTMVDGAFFMVTTMEAGTEVDCAVPLGVPIVFSHAAYYAWIPDDGLTDEEIQATAEERFVTGDSLVTVDGRRVPLTTTEIGAFDVISEAGSAFDAILGLGTGPVRTAVVGQFTVLHPLRPGNHEVFGSVDFTPVGGPVLDITYHVTVS